MNAKRVESSLTLFFGQILWDGAQYLTGPGDDDADCQGDRCRREREFFSKMIVEISALQKSRHYRTMLKKSVILHLFVALTGRHHAAGRDAQPEVLTASGTLRETRKEMAVDTHLRLVQDILSRNDIAAHIKEQVGHMTAAIYAREKDPSLYLTVAGEFSTGKSTLINAFIRENLLRSDSVQATTAAATLVRYGDKAELEVRYTNNQTTVFPEDERSLLLAELHRVTADESVAQNVAEVTLRYPADVCRHGLVMIDTPGMNALNHRHMEVTVRAIRELSDVSVVIIPADAPLSDTILTFVQQNLTDVVHRCLFVVSKLDLIRGADQRRKLLDNIRKRLELALGVSANQVLPMAPALVTDQKPDADDENAQDFDLNERRQYLAKNAELFVWHLETERAIWQLLKKQWPLLQTERLLVLMDRLFQPLTDELTLLEAGYAERHQALMQNKIADLGVFAERQKKEHIRHIKDRAVKLRKKAIDCVDTESKHGLQELRNRIYGASDRENLRQVVKTAPASMLNSVRASLSTSIRDQAIQPVYTIGKEQLVKFEAEFKVLYEKLTTLGGTIAAPPQANNQLVLLGGAIAVGQNAIVSFFEEIGLGGVVNKIADFFGGIFGPPLEKVKDENWEKVRKNVEEAFEQAEKAALRTVDNAVDEVCGQLQVVIDQYFASYDKQVKLMIARDEAEAAQLAKQRQAINRDLAALSQSKHLLAGIKDKLRQS